MMSQMFEEAEISPPSIDAIAVTLGPGSFSGIRIAVSTARAFAMPDNKTVVGITTGEALAWEEFSKRNAVSVTTMGDARRGHLWHARFVENNGLPEMVAPYSLTRAEALSDILARGSMVVTPDWDRIGPLLTAISLPDTQIIREKRTPRASTVGKLAFMKIVGGLALDEPNPIYLHPPVSAKPAAYNQSARKFSQAEMTTVEIQ